MNTDKSSKSSTNSPAKTMAELLKKHEASSFVSLQRGQEIKGKVTKISSQDILLDIGAKTEAVVLEKDRQLHKNLTQLLKVGDSVIATVLYPESDMGYPVVSLRRFAEDHLWVMLEKLKKSAEKLDVRVTEATRGGFLVETDSGLKGFLPNSHVTGVKDPQALVGTVVKATIVDLNRELHKIIFSQKGLVSSDDFKKAIAGLKAGDKLNVTVSGITSFGVFATLPLKSESHIDGLIHISEVSWEKVTDITTMFQVGQTIDVVVIGFDEDAKRIDLSIKRLTEDPFAEIAKAFPVDARVSGTVIEITDQGVLLDLGKPVEAMIRKDKIPPTVSYKKGQKVSATVTQIDSRKRRIFLVPVLLEKTLMYR
ncbi:MAG: S1 RNA-binding domain-containing protein [Candidatus Levyibacteriota bacterium]